MKFGELIDKRHRKIPFASWIAEAPKAQVYVLHGYAEHFRRYDRFAQNLNLAGYSVHAFDLPGHGAAEGRRGHIDSFQDYIDSLLWFIEENPNREENLPTFLFGHSMGALISAHMVIQKQQHLQGLILGSPLTGFGGLLSSAGWALAKFLGRNQPDRLIPKPLDPKDLTHLEWRHPEYTSDPLRLTTLSPALFLGMLSWSDLLHKNAHLLKIPLLVFYSRADQVVNPLKIEAFFRAVKSRDKELVAFSQAGHEILNDKEEGQMTEKITAWIAQHLPT
ncbi:MAG: alpha/beta hydrolase [bacterium]|nr:alpha/beta hydrolase [bacterium]